ncbi:MAG: hypothetical protein LBS12_01560 [Prevotellaceae bacterium]|jgi:hypothetical protein|nr:hypothetical protein [Prevotellaceae bacterium]
MKHWFFSFLMLAGLYMPAWALAQAPPQDIQLRQAEALQMQYRFAEAADLLTAIIAQSADSAAREEATRRLIVCENGQTMLRYIERPTVTGKTAVPEHLFFQYYDIELPGAWATLPSGWHAGTPADDSLSPVFIPSAAADALYYSAFGSGNWDILTVRRLNDTLWSPPEPLNGAVNTPFDERFPYLSPDATTLYFASNGHSGMGGYDLYKSEWNRTTQEWGVPENLGFPYSSPYDDWLFVPNTAHTAALFASSREQKADSLTLYRIALEANPVKRLGYSIQEIQHIGKLEPAAAPAPTVAPPTPATDSAGESYQTLYRQLAQQQADEQILQRSLLVLRKSYGELTDAGERAAMQSTILERETDLSRIQAGIRQTTEAIREAEAALLAQGILPDIRPPAEPPPAAPEMSEMPAAFNPQRQSPVAFPAIAIQPPVEDKKEDDVFRFRVDKTSVIHPWPTGLAGLVYRIQTGTYSRKLPAREFKGLSPVFEQVDRKRYIYHIGQFRMYDEAVEALPEVKRKGFRDAVLTAAIDGKKTAIAAAREYEQRQTPATPPADGALPASFHVLLGEFPNGLPAALQQAVKAATPQDIVKKTSRGQTVYMVGPFASLEKAQQLQSHLQAQGFETRIEN